jgi:membrane protein CcdC involved in cytochrome C biogenesis
MSLIISAIAAVVGIIYSLVVDGSVLTSYIINAGVITGALVLAAGWLVFALPLPKTGGDYTRRHFLQRRPFVFSPKQKGIELLDHSNFEKYMKAREMKRNHAYDIIYVGLGVFLLTGIAEIIMWRLTN